MWLGRHDHVGLSSKNTVSMPVRQSITNGEHELDFQTLTTRADHLDRPWVGAVGDEPDGRCLTGVLVASRRFRKADSNGSDLTEDSMLRQNRIGAVWLHGDHFEIAKRDD